MANTKQYIITSITLGIIAMASAGLIGATNLLTRNRILQNEKDKINAGIVEIFGENSEIKKEINLADYKYVTGVYEIQEKGNTTLTGCAFKTSGSNMYGKISMLAGFGYYTKPNSYMQELVFLDIYVVVNEQTYKSTLEDNYISKINDDDIEFDYKDVNCGATYGAKLIRDMIDEAKQVADSLYGLDYGE